MTCFILYQFIFLGAATLLLLWQLVTVCIVWIPEHTFCVIFLFELSQDLGYYCICHPNFTIPF